MDYEVLPAVFDPGEALKHDAPEIHEGPQAGASALLHDDGSVTLYTKAQEIGRGIYTTLAQMVAEELGLCVLRRNGNPLIGHGSYKGCPKTDCYPSLAIAKGLFTSAYGFAAQAAEVKVDTATGEVQLMRAVTFHYCGYPLNRQRRCRKRGSPQADVVWSKSQARFVYSQFFPAFHVG